MNIDLASLVPQLGIVAFVVLLVYRLATQAITQWGKVEEGRTEVLRDLAAGISRLEGHLGTRPVPELAQGSPPPTSSAPGTPNSAHPP